MTDTNTAEREAIIRAAVAAMPHTNPLVADDLLGGFTMHTEADDIVAIFQAGRASLAANAGSEPVALDPRHIRKFLQALQAGEMSVARAVEILDAWVEGRYSDDMVPPPPADSCLIADDEFPMEIVRKLRSEMATHPSPPEGMAGQALRQVLSVVQRYLPPDGPSAHDAMSEITAIVDPWPLGPLEKP